MAVIGINAMPVDDRPVGVGRYARNLVCGLLEKDPENEYVILVNAGNRGFFEELGPGLKLEEISSLSRYRPLRLLMEELFFPRLCKKRKLDIFHGIASMNPKRLPCLSVITIHDMTYFLYPELHMLSKSLYFRRKLPEAVRRADHVITDSHRSREDILRLLNVPPEKVTTVYPGIESRFQRVEDRETKDSALRKYGIEVPFVFFVGVLEPRKNIPRLLKAFSLFKKKSPDERVSLVVAGKRGWRLGELDRTLETLDCREDVNLVGYVEDEDLPALYSAAELFVYPSLYEGFGFPVLEAMACGTPVLTSGVSSLEEVAGDAAIVVDPTSVEDIARGFEEGFQESRRKELKSLGLRRASEFTIERSAAETIAVYRKILGKTSR